MGFSWLKNQTFGWPQMLESDRLESLELDCFVHCQNPLHLGHPPFFVRCCLPNVPSPDVTLYTPKHPAYTQHMPKNSDTPNCCCCTYSCIFCQCGHRLNISLDGRCISPSITTIPQSFLGSNPGRVEIQ